MPGLSDKRYPRLDIRLGREAAIRLEAEAKLRGLGESAFGRRVLEGVLSRPEAVEQALGEESAGGSTSRPAPAELSEEPYVPEWKKRTAYQQRVVVPIPKKEK